jgi:hypothetical protein
MEVETYSTKDVVYLHRIVVTTARHLFGTTVIEALRLSTRLGKDFTSHTSLDISTEFRN